MADESKTAEPGVEVESEELTLDAKTEPSGVEGEPPDFDRRDGGEENGLKRAIFNVPIEVVVCVGTARPLIGDLLNMGRNHLLPLDSKIDDPVELRVRDRVVARGELAQVPGDDEQLGIRLTEVVNLSELTE